VNENLSFTAALGGMATDTAQTRQVLAHFGVAGRGEQLVRHLSQDKSAACLVSTRSQSSTAVGVG